MVFNTTILAEDANGVNVSMAYTLSYPEGCCNPSEKGCYIVQAVQHSIYKPFPAPLLYMLALPWITPFSVVRGNHVIPSIITDRDFIGCWSTPPFCACQQENHIALSDFTTILVGHIANA